MINKSILCVFLLFLCCGINLCQGAEKIEVFVSILPQKYFVERLGAEHVNVNVMVKPGQSPETFEPSPKLMNTLAHANVFFTIGMPFEKVWIQRVSSINQSLIIADTQPDTRLLLKAHRRHVNEFDPHTWLSPLLAIKQSETIYEYLSALKPQLKGVFENNLIKLKQDLLELDENISLELKNYSHTDRNHFMVFHPAFSYYARQYGLEQWAIEVGGKEPSSRQMAKIINRIKEKQVKWIIVEKQFDQSSAKTIAKSINAELIALDPLAKDYITNLKLITQQIKTALF